MRSRPYRPPPPLPPLLDDLATYLPNSDHRRPSNDGGSGEVPLSEIDPESGRLLPKKKPQQQHLHRVRVQGKLALVRSVSVAELRPMGGGDGSPMLSLPRATMRHRGVALDSGVGAVMPGKSRRRCSLDDVGSGGDDDDDDSDDYDEEISERDTQPRGYGIGGAGNIRRSTCYHPPIQREDGGYRSFFKGQL